MILGELAYPVLVALARLGLTEVASLKVFHARRAYWHDRSVIVLAQALACTGTIVFSRDGTGRREPRMIIS